ncbi:MAG: hypothetical protein QXR97_03645 [Thermoproteota archaeon]
MGGYRSDSSSFNSFRTEHDNLDTTDVHTLTIGVLGAQGQVQIPIIPSREST